MPDPTSHHPSMLIIRPNTMPRLWWLFPWSYARQLHRNCVALKALTDKQDDLLRGRYTTRPRYTIYPQYVDATLRYYFHDTDPEFDRGRASEGAIKGIMLLYDHQLRCHVWEDNPTKAIRTLTELNAR